MSSPLATVSNIVPFALYQNQNLMMEKVGELQRALGQIEGQVETMLKTVEGQGKKLWRIEILIATFTGGVVILIYLLNLLVKNIDTILALAKKAG